MREKFADTAALVVACICAIAMACGTLALATPRNAVADEVSVPSYCGDKSVIMLTSTGEVYQVYVPDNKLPATGDVTTNNGEVAAQCIIPLPYLPAKIIINTALASTDPYRYVRTPGLTGGSGAKRWTYEALASNTENGDIWATLNTGSSTMQVYRLTKDVREEHASNPNPAYTLEDTRSKLSKTYWEQIGNPVAYSNRDTEMATGGAVDKATGAYYIAAVNSSQCHPTANSRVSQSCSTTSKTRVLANWDIDFYTTSGETPVKAGTLRLTDGDYALSNLASDIEFDEQGNLTVILSWNTSEAAKDPTTGRMTPKYTRYVRRVHIPVENVANKTFVPDSDSMLDTNTSLPITRPIESEGSPKDLYISGIGSLGQSSEDLTISMQDVSYPIGEQSLYNMTSDGTLTDVFDLPGNPPYHMTADQEGRPKAMVLENESLWGGGSSHKTTNGPSFGFWSNEITDIADGIGVEPPKPYYGSYQFKKIDDSNNALKDAEFTMWPRPSDGQCTSVPATDATSITLGSDGKPTGKKTVPSDDSGLVKFENVPLGQAKSSETKSSAWFCVVETKAPMDFKLNSTAWQVELKPGETTSGNDVKNERDTGTVTVVKYDDTVKTKTLEGAKFELVEDTNKNGKADSGEPVFANSNDVRTTGSDGKVTWTNVPLGKTYVIHEVSAPTGYKTMLEADSNAKEESFTLTSSVKEISRSVYDVRKEGQIVWDKYAEGTLTWAARGTINKGQTLPTHGTLTGSQWQLTYKPDSGNTEDATWTKTIADCTSNGCEVTDEGKQLLDGDATGGLFKLTNLKWGTYTLTETQAPLGYLKNVDSNNQSLEYTFTINQNNVDQIQYQLITNKQASGPTLPASGGTSADLYKFVAGGLFAGALLAGLGVLLKNRRRLNSRLLK